MSKKEGIKITDFETVVLVDRRVFIAKILLLFMPISANIEYHTVKTNILYWFATVNRDLAFKNFWWAIHTKHCGEGPSQKTT